MKKEICDYCGKRFQVTEICKIPGYDPRNQYCKRCYKTVLKAIEDLPWNKNKGLKENREL